ncbi:MAG: hypothetical protein ACLGI2_06300 [Acidimicrobiia bacterium]
MHARVQIVRNLPEEFAKPAAASRLTDVIDRHPGFQGIHLMLQIGTRQGLNVTLWDTEENAVAASDRTAAAMGPRPFPLATDEVYDVLDSLDGPAAMADATVCQATWFDGPRSAAQNEALRRGGQERIAPAIRDTPGLVRTYVLCHPADSAIVVLTLAMSVETLERIADAVFGTTLLPGEDPALLDGPDRVDIYRVHASVLAAVRA